MFFRTVLLFIFDISLALVTYPVLFIFLGPVLLYRIIVIGIVRLCYPSYIPGGMVDQTVQYDYFATKNDPLIFSTGAMVTVHGSVSVSRLKERWRKQFLEATNSSNKLLYPKLSATLVRIGGYIFFKPLKQVNGDDIFREEELDVKDLEEFKTSFLARPYKKDCPLWEVIVINFGQETKMFYRFHHALADGYTQLHLLNESMKPTIRKMAMEREPEYTLRDLIRAGIIFPRIAVLYMSEIFRTRNGIPLFANSQDRARTSSTHIYFSDLKQIYRKTGANFLSINLALYAAVLGRILKAKGLHSEEFIAVQTAMPWPNHPSREGKMGNHFSASILRIPMGVMTTLERVKEIDKAIKIFQQRMLDKIIWWYWLPMIAIFPSTISGHMIEGVQRILGLKLMSSTLLSFEEFEYETDGSPVIAIKPLLSRSGYGTVLITSTVIYNERCEVTFVGTSAVAEDQMEMDKIVNEYYLEEMEALLEQVLKKDQLV